MLISGFRDRQPAADVSHKPSSRLPLLSVRPAVTFPAFSTYMQCNERTNHYVPWMTSVTAQAQRGCRGDALRQAVEHARVENGFTDRDMQFADSEVNGGSRTTPDVLSAF